MLTNVFIFVIVYTIYRIKKYGTEELTLDLHRVQKNKTLNIIPQNSGVTTNFARLPGKKTACCYLPATTRYLLNRSDRYKYVRLRAKGSMCWINSYKTSHCFALKNILRLCVWAPNPTRAPCTPPALQYLQGR